ncbi:PH domain-containing protein [Catellatospora vulcania]|uniref:PH domain-containing protein n=1 Tax=Catellatospora vulcania TaxID=1460450 RepID=UPI0018AFB8FB|nr:PH domain-containing protein [Catellatospora vulcania]
MAGALAIVVGFAEFHFGRLILTDKRIIVLRGVFFRRASTLPLSSMADVTCVQSPLGSLLGYGSLVITGAGRRSGMRTLADLPDPTELYLRIIEEVYEPAAVEARQARELGQPGDFSLGSPALPVEARIDRNDLRDAVREILHGKPLVNFSGWLSVAVHGDGASVDPGEKRNIRIDPARGFQVAVTISPTPRSPIAEKVSVTDGETQPRVQFDLEIDSDHPTWRQSGRTVVIEHGGTRRVEFSIGPLSSPFQPPPWLWVRISQQRRTLQSIELAARYTTEREVDG